MNITDNGYVHEQDNQKIIRSKDGDKLLVEEKGLKRIKELMKRNVLPLKIIGKRIKSIGERSGRYGLTISARMILSR